jgi:hypothetical protein
VDVTEGRLIVSVDLTVTAAEMQEWSPERIRALFAGLAQLRQATETAPDS